MGNTPKYCPALPCAIKLLQVAGAGEPDGEGTNVTLGVPLTVPLTDTVPEFEGVADGLEPWLVVVVVEGVTLDEGVLLDEGVPLNVEVGENVDVKLGVLETVGVALGVLEHEGTSMTLPAGQAEGQLQAAHVAMEVAPRVAL